MPRHRSLAETLISSPARRARTVWLSLMMSMTAVGGLPLLVDGRSAPRADGLALPLLMASGPTASVESIFQTRRTLQPGRWTSIVIHHSGSPVGTAASITAEHERLRFKGLGHHFLIGNGQGMDDGELHVGYRWLDQLPGAHAGGPEGEYYNLNAISICLVGDGDRRPFTPAQLARLEQLLRALTRELGVPADKVVLHSDIAPTSDPGRLFPKAWLREVSRRAH